MRLEQCLDCVLEIDAMLLNVISPLVFIPFKGDEILHHDFHALPTTDVSS
jgi:hypothetical protein